VFSATAIWQELHSLVDVPHAMQVFNEHIDSYSLFTAHQECLWGQLPVHHTPTAFFCKRDGCIAHVVSVFVLYIALHFDRQNGLGNYVGLRRRHDIAFQVGAPILQFPAAPVVVAEDLEEGMRCVRNFDCVQWLPLLQQSSPMPLRLQRTPPLTLNPVSFMFVVSITRRGYRYGEWRSSS
jgi:hypothetical protein